MSQISPQTKPPTIKPPIFVIILLVVASLIGSFEIYERLILPEYITGEIANRIELGVR